MAKCIRMSKPRPLTLAQAREKARARWGLYGYAVKSGKSFIVGKKYFSSGIDGAGDWAYDHLNGGRGKTLEAADADRREAEAKEKISNG